MIAVNQNPRTLMEAMRHFDIETAEKFIAGIKWPEGPCCPKCGSINVGAIPSRRRFQCREKGCRRQFSLTTNTILEATHLRADQWVIAIWLIVNSKNGISSCEMARTLGCKQQSAWHLLHRVRHVIAAEHSEQLRGVVESDETFVGGLQKFMSMSRRIKARAKLNGGKAVVHGLKERASGKVRAEVIPAATTEYIRDAVLENVEEGSILCTDESHVYKWARAPYYHHRTVNHADRYVNGIAHTNGLECFFNCLRRGLKGTYIRATPDHLTAYVDEQVYRFNHRKLTDWERFEGAMRMIVGKRLTYSALTDGAVR